MSKKLKKTLNACVLKMPTKLKGIITVFNIAVTTQGLVRLYISNNPDWTPKVKEIIVVYENNTR